jgi:tripartite-type tricarboxylate transporter receptor subunit TctC
MHSDYAASCAARIAFGFAVLTTAYGSAGRAADWPTRPVSVVVPFGAGGNTDMMARMGSDWLASKFGQPFVVENKPSAGGAIASGEVANAPPDGSKIMFSASSAVHITPRIQKLTFDPSKLVPVVNVGTGAQIIAIKRSLPVTNLAEFIAYAKSNPGKLNFVVAGTGNISHLAPMLINAVAGIDMVMVPAKSGPQAVSDLMSGEVDLYFGNASELLVHKDSPKIRLIAVGTATRIAAAPDIPAAAETLPGLVFSSWNGFFVPLGTPETTINAMRDSIAEFTKLPATIARLNELGIVPGGLTREQTETTFAADSKIFGEAIKAAGMPPP